jgi:hypothetical protein
VTACSLRCKPPPTLEITSVDSFGESGLDRIVVTHVVVICRLACVGTFVEAVGQGPVRLGRHNAVGKISSGSSREGDDGSGDIVGGEFGRPAIINNHHMPEAIFGVTPPLQDGLPIKGDFATCFVEKHLAHCMLRRMTTDRRLLIRPGSQCARHALGGRLLRSRLTA